MNSYELNLKDVAFDELSMNVYTDTGEFDVGDGGREPEALSVTELVDLFIQYRKRVGRCRTRQKNFRKTQ